MYYCHGNLYKGGGVGIGGYFYTLLVTSVCGSICAVMVSGGFEKYIKYIASLICVAVMVSPFRSIDFSQITEKAVGDLTFSQISQGGLYETAGEITEERAKDYINDILFNKFGIKPMSVNIEIDWGKEEPIIEGISICLSSKDFPKGSEIKDYLFTVLGGEVEIIEG